MTPSSPSTACLCSKQPTPAPSQRAAFCHLEVTRLAGERRKTGLCTHSSPYVAAPIPTLMVHTCLTPVLPHARLQTERPGPAFCRREGAREGATSQPRVRRVQTGSVCTDRTCTRVACVSLHAGAQGSPTCISHVGSANGGEGTTCQRDARRGKVFTRVTCGPSPHPIRVHTMCCRVRESDPGG